MKAEHAESLSYHHLVQMSIEVIRCSKNQAAVDHAVHVLLFLAIALDKEGKSHG